LGRQTQTGGETSVGTGCTARLDPSLLPVRFTASDAARDHVVIRRVVLGMPVRIRLPLTAFTGVTLKLTEPADDGAERMLVSLEHRDPGLCVPLYSADDDGDAVAEWQLWSRVLGQPLLVTDATGGQHSPFPSLGALHVGAPSGRRRRRTAIQTRRRRRALRRQLGIAASEPTIHREDEIIARD
jgi:hypothetical protein